VIITNEHRQKVVYLSQTYPGKTHDKKVAEQEAIQYPAHSTLTKDTGFQGYEPLGVWTIQPKKKPKGKILGTVDQLSNRFIASVRIKIEHVLAGIKRCRIVKEVLRNTKDGFSDLVMQIACGLHNLRVSFRRPSSRSPQPAAYSR
jgi:hypothetical protein